MSEKKIIKPKKVRPPKNKDLPKAKFTKDPKYKHVKNWLPEDDDDDDQGSILDIFGKDEEE